MNCQQTLVIPGTSVFAIAGKQSSGLSMPIKGHWIASLRSQRQRIRGFTLIEVLLALSVIAIALTALLKASSQNIDNTHRIKEKNISHWIAMQGVAMIQLNLLQVSSSQESTQVTNMLGQKWYWRAKASNTPLKKIQMLTISVSSKQSGPFRQELIGFRYLNENS